MFKREKLKTHWKKNVFSDFLHNQLEMEYEHYAQKQHKFSIKRSPTQTQKSAETFNKVSDTSLIENI